MKMLKNILAGLMIFLSFFQSVSAQEFVPPMPSDLEKTRISLMTVGLGEDLASRYGHTMLRVEDPSNQLDYLVNWGIFDFSDPMFIPKFFRGILIYQMGFSSTVATIKYYRGVEHRSVMEDELSLTADQKQKLLEKIIWNAQPENYRYPYQYFRNNCSTVPRDYLDLVTNGAIKKEFGGVEVPLTYRDYVRMNLSNNPFIAWGLDVLFNGDNDHRLTKWQEMFYPLKLREYLATLPRFDDQGHPDSRQSLLINHRIIVDLPEPPWHAIDGYFLTWIVAGVPLLVVGFVMLYGRRRGEKELPAWCFRAFGIVSIWWGCTSGFFGLIHFSGWLFSSHTDLHRNLNILLFWPVDPLVLILGVQMGIFGRKWSFSGRLKPGFWRVLAKLHLAVIPVYALVSLSGYFVQDTTRVLIYMAPLSLLYYGTMALLAWYADGKTLVGDR